LIRKDNLGPGGHKRVRHEVAVLERLAGVDGVFISHATGYTRRSGRWVGCCWRSRIVTGCPNMGDPLTAQARAQRNATEILHAVASPSGRSSWWTTCSGPDGRRWASWPTELLAANLLEDHRE
jgi:hypothetical protein